MADHVWKHTYFKSPTWCNYCKNFIWGVTSKQGFRCTVCKNIAHEKCRPCAPPCGNPAVQLTNDDPIGEIEVKQAKALYKFEPENDRELKLLAGDIITVLETDDPDWWFGTVEGREGDGYFPENYVQKIGDWKS